MLTSRTLIFISLCLYLFSSEATHLFDDDGERFIKLNTRGMAMNRSASTWDCVLDRKTTLIWEIKTTQGLRHHKHTYTWYNPQPAQNVSTAGLRNGGQCSGSACDTLSYVNEVNHSELCGYHQWRLPSMEELRTLVDYQMRPPNPAINTDYFPHTQPQFYWSITADANEQDSAWGVGFTFGYDYRYFKSDLGHVRLVTNG